MARRYDNGNKVRSNPTSINTPELEAQTAETLGAQQERAERLHQAAEALGSLATEQANAGETDQAIEGGVVIEGNFGTTEESVQAELKRLEEEARSRIEQLQQAA